MPSSPNTRKKIATAAVGLIFAFAVISSLVASSPQQEMESHFGPMDDSLVDLGPMQRMESHFGLIQEASYRSFHYSGQLLFDRNNDIIGIFVAMENRSTEEPLQMQSLPNCIPIGVQIVGTWRADSKSIDNKSLAESVKVAVAVPCISLRPNIINGTKDSFVGRKLVDWIIPPVSTRRYFIPLNKLLPDIRELDRKFYSIKLFINAFPSWIKLPRFEHPFEALEFGWIPLNGNALEANSDAVFSETLTQEMRREKAAESFWERSRSPRD